MPIFQYKAVDSSGREKKGSLDAESERQARQSLREQGLTPLAIYAVDEETPRLATSSNIPGRRYRMNIAEVALFTRQLATLLQASLPLEEALQAIIEQIEKPKPKTTRIFNLYGKFLYCRFRYRIIFERLGKRNFCFAFCLFRYGLPSIGRDDIATFDYNSADFSGTNICCKSRKRDVG